MRCLPPPCESAVLCFNSQRSEVFNSRLGSLKRCRFDKDTVGVLSYRNYRYGLGCKRELISRPQVFRYSYLVGDGSDETRSMVRCYETVKESVVNLCVHPGDTSVQQPSGKQKSHPLTWLPLPDWEDGDSEPRSASSKRYLGYHLSYFNHKPSAVVSKSSNFKHIAQGSVDNDVVQHRIAACVDPDGKTQMQQLDAKSLEGEQLPSIVTTAWRLLQDESFLEPQQQLEVLVLSLERYYEKHAPQKKKMARKALEHYRGREEVLLKKLEQKYKEPVIIGI